MHLVIERKYFDPDSPDRGIMGHLYINGVYVCDTLEPPYKSQFGCVDAGHYSLVLRYSPSYKRNMWYLDMAKAGSSRSGIMFHIGNTSSNSKGCILLGFIHNSVSFFLTGSTLAFKVFTDNLFGELFVDLDIKDNYA